MDRRVEQTDYRIGNIIPQPAQAAKLGESAREETNGNRYAVGAGRDSLLVLRLSQQRARCGIGLQVANPYHPERNRTLAPFPTGGPVQDPVLRATEPLCADAA